MGDFGTEGFFSRNASDTQKFSGFMIFQLMLSPGATHDFILGSIFSKNFMVCLMNQAAEGNRYLNRAAIKTLSAIERAVELEPDVLDPILDRLLNHNGTYSFDQRTNSKTIEHLLCNAQGDSKALVISLLRVPVLDMKGYVTFDTTWVT